MNKFLVCLAKHFFICFLVLIPTFASGQDAVSKSLFNKYNRYKASSTRIFGNGTGDIIQVNTQELFDSIQGIIDEKINAGYKSIEVRIGPGVYRYSDKHLSLCNYSAGDVSLSIVGEDATLVAGGDDFDMQKSLFSQYRRSRYDSSFPYGSVLLADDLSELSLSSGIQQTDRLLEVVNKEERICRIHTNSSRRFNNGRYIIVTTWFTSVSGPIIKVEGDWIYFKSSALFYAESYKNYNINYDYVYSKRYPRYVVFNDPNNADVYFKGGEIFLSAKSERIHQCNNSTFLLLKNSRFKDLSIKGLSFVGSAEGQPLMDFQNSKCPIVISNCAFRSIKSFVVGIRNTDDVLVAHCSFNDCYKSCIRSYLNSKRTHVTDCVFSDNGRDYTQYHCVWCQGEDYYIARNIFKNISYAAIRTGLLPDEKKTGIVSGIIEYNEIYYDRNYFSSYESRSLMDSGAIYVSTQNDNTIIRYNYIHDYIGLKENRGVFCDTGTQNTRIYGNIILNVPNSYYIDIWRVKTYDSVIPDANDGNAVFYNILGGRYRFEGKVNARSNNLGCNYILYKGDKPHVVVRELSTKDSDVFIKCDNPIDLNTIRNNAQIRKLPIYNALQYFWTK